MEEETSIISLGGSLIIPDQIDVEFLKDFRELILEKVANGKRFVIVTGGGKICRRYQDVAKEVINPGKEDLDWIGIASLRLNAELLRVLFGEKAYHKVIFNLSEDLNFREPIIIGAAYEPGQSTDWDAILAAKNIGAKRVINLSNTDYVYDSDPKVNSNAKKIEKISWADYRKLIPSEWNPGFSSPFDPIASKMAEENNIEVNIMNGKPIDNLRKCLNGEEFQGTKIF